MQEVLSGTPIEVAGQVVGYFLGSTAPGRMMGMMSSPEQTFLFSLRRAIILAALAAVIRG